MYVLERNLTNLNYIIIALIGIHNFLDSEIYCGIYHDV